MQLSLSVNQFITTLNQHSFQLDDLQHLLQSNRPHLVQIFQAILNHPQYQIVAKKLLTKIITNVYKMVNEPLELYIISNIWKKDFLHLYYTPNLKYQTQSPSNPIDKDILLQVYMFLCQKMRSLKFITRITALKSLQALLKSVLTILSSPHSAQSWHQGDITPQQAQGFDSFLSYSLKRMLKKQQLGKVVSYNQGLFLQLLQDEFHEIRVTTLAVLQLVSLNTPYFYTIQLKRGENQQTQAETLYTLKQTILYMLNDEHQLVRQRSLVAIFRISEIRNMIKNVEVFNPLSKQEIFTILMCLRENNAVLREKVYECLKVLAITSIDDFLMILERLYQTLLTYKQDKTKIYWLLKAYSKSQKDVILRYIFENPKDNIRRFYEFNGEEEPNCKNIIYKGKIILLREVMNELFKFSKVMKKGNPQFSNILPGYILRHSSFVEDTQFRLKYKDSQRQDFIDSKSFQNQEIGRPSQEIQVSEKGLLDKENPEKIKYLQKLKSIIIYEYDLTEKNSFQQRLLWIVLETVKLILMRFTERSESSKELKVGPKKPQHNAISHNNFLYQVVKDKPQSKQFLFDESTQTMAVDQSEVEEFLYGSKTIRNNNSSKSQGNKITSSEQGDEEKRMEDIQFEIKYIKYIYSLESSSNQSIRNFNTSNTIIQLLSSIQKVLQTLPELSYSSEVLCSQIEKYLRTEASKSIQLREKRFRIRPITVGRASLGTGYNDKLLIMIEHPSKITHGMNLSYNNDNIWLKLTTSRIEFNPKLEEFKQMNKQMTYYVKFSQLFTLSEMRPLIDYNQNKTMYSAEIPLKITDSKQCLLVKLLKNSFQREITKMSTENQSQIHNSGQRSSNKLNVEKFIEYQEKQIVIKSAAIVFVHDRTESNNYGIKKETKRQPPIKQQWEKIKEEHHQNEQGLKKQYKNQKVLVEWNAANIYAE